MLTYREITGLWSARVPDGPDSDQYPDTILLEGHVTFEPEYRVPLVYPGEHIVVEPMHAVIHEGVLYGETVVGDDVARGPLFLPVTVDDAANQSWSWLARFQGMRLGEYGEEVALPNVRFQVPAGEDALDLSAVIPASQSGGTITVRGAPGPGLSDITSADGQLTFVWDNGREKSLEVPGVGSPHDLDDRGELGDLDLDDLPYPSGIWTRKAADEPGPGFPPGVNYGVLASLMPSFTHPPGSYAQAAVGQMLIDNRGDLWVRGGVHTKTDGVEQANWGAWARVPNGRVEPVGTNNDRTIAPSDAGKAIEFNASSARTLTIPAHTTDMPIGTVVEVHQRGTGTVTITPAAGVTLRWAGSGTPRLRAQYSVCTLRKRATNEWVLSGDLAGS